MPRPNPTTPSVILLRDLREGSRVRTARHRAKIKQSGMVVKQLLAPDAKSAEIFVALARALHIKSDRV